MLWENLLGHNDMDYRQYTNVPGHNGELDYIYATNSNTAEIWTGTSTMKSYMNSSYRPNLPLPTKLLTYARA